jgi:hypothetical protein
MPQHCAEVRLGRLSNHVLRPSSGSSLVVNTTAPMQTMTEFGGGHLMEPTDVAVLASSTVLAITDVGNHGVHLFDISGGGHQHLGGRALLDRPYSCVTLPAHDSAPELLIVGDRNHHCLRWLDVASQSWVKRTGSKGTLAGQFGGPRGLALVPDADGCLVLAVVENDNGRVQLVDPRTGEPLRILSMSDPRTGLGLEIRGPGGCTVVSERWRRVELANAPGGGGGGGLLALCDSHGEQRILIVEIGSGLVHHILTAVDEPPPLPPNPSATATAATAPTMERGTIEERAWFPAGVAEPQPGVLAVTDRANGRVILFRRGDKDGDVTSSVLLEGLVRPVGCGVLPDGSLAVTDTGRGLIKLVCRESLLAAASGGACTA